MRGRPPILLLCLAVAALGAGCDSEPKLKVEVAKTPAATSGTALAAPEAGAPAAAAHPPSVASGDRPAPPLPPGAQLPAGHPPLSASDAGASPGGVRLPIVAPGGEGGNAVVWTVPAGWKSEMPANPTRRAQYRVPGRAGDGEFLVFYFGPGQGGDPASNAERWAAQFEPESGKAAAKKTRTLTAGGMKVLVIETAGTYLAGSMIGGQVERKPGWALLGAVVEGPDANWYFKFTGPKATVEAQRAAFDGLLRSLKRGG
jgi:hypothetical protein